MKRHRSSTAPLRLFLLAVTIVLFVVACSGRPASKPASPDGPPSQTDCNPAQWTIDFTRSGGFAGQTLSLHLLSSGSLTASGPGAQVRGKAPADKLAQIGQLLREACPYLGTAGGNLRDCQDCFSYSLQVGLAGQTFLTQVTEGHLGSLGPLIGALNSLLETALAGQT